MSHTPNSPSRLLTRGGCWFFKSLTPITQDYCATFGFGSMIQALWELIQTNSCMWHCYMPQDSDSTRRRPKFVSNLHFLLHLHFGNTHSGETAGFSRCVHATFCNHWPSKARQKEGTPMCELAVVV
ncbi:hypothetical protein BDR07DRAFT_1001578 [Suillus spraguei]|nr:hypothetical protein BDR07DRAFT_1001578 [Suillus spraguei]